MSRRIVRIIGLQEVNPLNHPAYVGTRAVTSMFVDDLGKFVLHPLRDSILEFGIELTTHKSHSRFTHIKDCEHTLEPTRA